MGLLWGDIRRLVWLYERCTEILILLKIAFKTPRCTSICGRRLVADTQLQIQGMVDLVSRF